MNRCFLLAGKHYFMGKFIGLPFIYIDHFMIFFFGWVDIEMSEYKSMNSNTLKHRSISVLQVTCSNPEAAVFVEAFFGLRASGSLKFIFLVALRP